MAFGKYLRPRLLTVSADTGDTISLAGGGAGPAVLIIPRSRLSFERIRLSGPEWKARAAAKLRLQQSTGSTAIRIRIVRDPEGDGAGLWSWVDTPVNNGANRLWTPRAAPEPLTDGPPADGAHLFTRIEGCEGQVWRAGALTASRWWSAGPDAREWALFLRSAQASAGTPPPHATSPVLRQRLLPVGADPDDLVRQFSPARLAALVGVVFAIGAFYETTRVIGHSAGAAVVRAKQERFLEENATTVRQRRQALSMRTTVDRLSASRAPAGVDALLIDVFSAIPADEARINRMELTNGSLEIRVSSDGGVDRAALVSRLEASELISRAYAEDIAGDRDFILRGSTPDFVNPNRDGSGVRQGAGS